MTFKEEILARLDRIDDKQRKSLENEEQIKDMLRTWAWQMVSLYWLIDRQADRICAAIPSREEISTIVSDQLTKTPKPISKGEGVKAKPKKKRRGPKNTAFMDYQRKTIIAYVVDECKRPLSSLTLADCHYVWNLPKHKATWDKRAKLKGDTRGYYNLKSVFRTLKRNIAKLGTT